jgi:hypothetical protein
LTINKDSHLEDDKLLWAVVDEAELPTSLRQHLSSCPQCRARKELVEQNLVRLGQRAEGFTPSPEKKVSLRFEEPRRSSWLSWSWRSALAVTITAALVIAVFWASNIFITTPDGRVANLTQESVEDERLMNEISLLVENALPSFYGDIAEEDNSLFDEEFMQFVVPTIDAEIMGNDLTTKGVALC